MRAIFPDSASGVRGMLWRCVNRRKRDGMVAVAVAFSACIPGMQLM